MAFEDTRKIRLKVGNCKNFRTLTLFLILQILNLCITAAIYSLIEGENEETECVANQRACMNYIFNNVFDAQKGDYDHLVAPGGQPLCNDGLPSQTALEDLLNQGSKSMNFQDMRQLILHCSPSNDKIMLDFQTGNLKWGLDECPDHWSFRGSLFFASTVATTVGYGGTSPQTDSGKMFFILSCVPSIAFGGMFMVALGKFIKFNMTKLAIECEDRVLKGEDKDSNPKKGAFAFAMIMVLFFYFFLFFFLPSIVYWLIMKDEPSWQESETNSHPFLIALYFHAVSSTSVGFGDFILDYESSNQNDVGLTFMLHFLNTMFLYMGLGVFAAHIDDLKDFFNTCEKFLEEKFKNCMPGTCSRLEKGAKYEIEDGGLKKVEVEEATPIPEAEAEVVLAEAVVDGDGDNQGEKPDGEKPEVIGKPATNGEAENLPVATVVAPGDENLLT